MLPTVTVSARGADRVHSGHPWIYRGDVAAVRAVAGDVVIVRGPRGRPIGCALFSDRSQISLRLLSFEGTDAGVDVAGLLRTRIQAALAFRETLRIDATAYRLVHGEADLLPSLVVDRYGDYLVVQTLSQGMDRLLPVLVSSLMELTGAKGILARNDPKVRLLEGLEQKVEVLVGDVPDVIEVREGRINYRVDPRHGQKTGLFLDQRENRVAAAQYAHGALLDCFSYNGGFALALADRCTRVEALDVSAEEIGRAHV